MSLVVDGDIEMKERGETQTQPPKMRSESQEAAYKQARQDMVENLVILIVTLILISILLVDKSPDPLISVMAGAGIFYLIIYLPTFIPHFLEIRRQYNAQS